MVKADLVKKLREKTGVGMMTCKEALREAGGDMEKAVEILRKKGEAKAFKRAGKVSKEGMVASYIHMGGKIGVLIEVSSETDFAAKSKDFKELVKDLTMHIAASNPLYIGREDVPNEVIAKEKEIMKAQVQNKPAAVIDKIVDGKMEKFYQEVCLLNQAFIKDDSISIETLLQQKSKEIGTLVTISRFIRLEVGA